MTTKYPGKSVTPEVTTLVQELSEAIRAVAGVVDLAPTLTGQAKQLGGKLLRLQPPADGQGIEVHLKDSTAIVAVDITAATWRPTVATAGQVQRAVATVLAAHRLSCTSVTVSVLALRA